MKAKTSKTGSVLQGSSGRERARGAGKTAALVQPRPSSPLLARAPRPELMPPAMQGGAAQPKPRTRGTNVPRPELLPAKMRGEVGRPKPARGRAAEACQPKYRAKGRLVTRGWYTQSGKYFIADSNTHKLYSKWGAADPLPLSLFTKSWEWSSGLKWSTWTPRVAFLASNVKRKDGDALKEYQQALARNKVGSFIFGKNDCSNFATALSSLIGEENGLQAQSVVLKGPLQIVKHGQVPVGTMMKHIYHGSEVCEYHAATVIAVDGSDLVTLEAHVSKSITTPEFHIRSGVLGFVRDNDPNRKYGDEVHLIQVDAKQIARAREYASMLDENSEVLLERGLVAR